MEQYIYDAAGRRVAKGTIDSFNCDLNYNHGINFHQTAAYVGGPGGEQMTEMQVASNGALSRVHTDVFAAGKLVATYQNDNGGATPISGNLHFAVNDWLGTKRIQTSYNGTFDNSWVSLPFGEVPPSPPGYPYSTPDATEQHFTGKERDSESGLDNFGARYYGSAMGRFMSPDPLNLTEERLANPSNTLNNYAYAANNPLKYVDPDGKDVTYFYDQGAVAGHAVLFAYNQQTGDSAIESFRPDHHWPADLGHSMYEMDSFKSAQDVREKFASLTIQTSPELAQEVINYIRANPDPALWTAIGPNCSTQVWKILQKFKLAREHGTDNKKDPGAFPSGIWRNLTAQYNPSAPQNPKNGTDYGAPRTDMFNALWLSLPQAPKDNATVTTQQCDHLPDGSTQCR